MFPFKTKEQKEVIKKLKEQELKNLQEAFQEGGTFLRKIQGSHSMSSIEILLRAHLASKGFTPKVVYTVINQLI